MQRNSYQLRDYCRNTRPGKIFNENRVVYQNKVSLRDTELKINTQDSLILYSAQASCRLRQPFLILNKSFTFDD
jgi:hypothetical protein